MREFGRRDMVVAVVSGLTVGLVLMVGQWWIDDARSDRAESLANVQYIRETVRDTPGGPKNFRGMNLRGADLSGVDMGCEVQINRRVTDQITQDPHGSLEGADPQTCADFTGADLSGAVLDHADISGAVLHDIDGDGLSAYKLQAVGASIVGDLNGANFVASNFAGALVESKGWGVGGMLFERTVLDGAVVWVGGADPQFLAVTLTGAAVVTERGDQFPSQGAHAYCQLEYPEDPWEPREMTGGYQYGHGESFPRFTACGYLSEDFECSPASMSLLPRETLLDLGAPYWHPLESCGTPTEPLRHVSMKTLSEMYEHAVKPRTGQVVLESDLEPHPGRS
ncbi:pentapeptide repeat-containing protein [Promicromonospora sukumoe]|uniref:Uncharacterized protein YjbI with pentapeptide repeats n=1 Tax=Promicromonospora sukumoe TaxID=88382 RepID=A0A7W3PCD2_9MICO|nr:pentapeptide repeat-containing protein [Promicromonospora sukumoe]MBA8806354.1 uncharacterized protein YjbI with pentapeptide repeats [Promicromonospora sukumoe]